MLTMLTMTYDFLDEVITWEYTQLLIFWWGKSVLEDNENGIYQVLSVSVSHNPGYKVHTKAWT